jgi:hypothetical protein
VRLLLDEDSQGRLLVRLLRGAGHDVVTVGEAGLNSRSDSEVFAHGIGEDRVLLTRNVPDFELLHNENRDHPGILAEYEGADTAKNMGDTDIARAIENLESSGWNFRGEFVALNDWQFAPRTDVG